jgi:hypothetical protein
MLLTGCNGSAASTGGASGRPTASPPTTSPTATAVAHAPVPANPCTLVSIAEATTAIGSAISTTDRAGKSCTYSGPSDGFSLTLLTSTGDDGWTLALIGLKAQAGSTPSIAGLGDRAVGADGVVAVQSGPTVFTIDDVFKDKDPHLAHAIAVAKVVLGHL